MPASVLLALLWAGPVQAAPPTAPAAGTITGVVRYTGALPPPKRHTTSEGTVLVQHDLIVSPKTKGARDVAVVVETAPAQPKLLKAEPAYVDQRELVFVPRVVMVQHGRAVRFDNSDSCNHSVMAVSTVKANTFNVFVAPGNPFETVFAPQRHAISVGCSLHAWMRAWVFVVPHPWFALSDTEGRFTLRDVPAGRHVLWLRHPDTGLSERVTVQVRPGQTSRVAVEWKAVAR
jgi:plastocyanin